MRFRFSVRWLFAAFLVVAFTLAWMASNVHHAQRERAFVVSLETDERLRSYDIRIKTESLAPKSMYDFVGMALNWSNTDVALTLARPPDPTLEYQTEFHRRVLDLDELLDSLTTVRVTELVIYADTVPGARMTGLWLSKVLEVRVEPTIDDELASIAELPLDRMSLLERLDFDCCRIDCERFSSTTFPALKFFAAMHCELRNSQALLSALTRSRDLGRINLLDSKSTPALDDHGNSTYSPLWSDADLKLIATLPKLEVLMISSARLVDDGISTLARCPNLWAVELDHSEVAVPIGPLLSHPGMMNLSFQFDSLRPTALVVEALGPAIRSVDFHHTPITRDFDALMRSYCVGRPIDYRSGTTADGKASQAP